MCACVRACVRVCVRACVCVNYSLMLHNVQTRDKFPCMILVWTIINRILSLWVQKDVSEHGGTQHTRDQLQIVMRCSWHILLYVSGGIEENEVE